MTEIRIQLNKKKILFLVIGSIAFVILGILFVSKPENFVSSQYQNITLIKSIGILSMSFFGACGIYGMIKLLIRSMD
jgi:hypothetical protein